MKKGSQIKVSGYSLIHNKLSKEDRSKKSKSKNKSKSVSSERKKGKGGKKTSSASTPFTGFSFKTIHGIPLVEMEYSVPPLDERERKRKEFKKAKAEFMKFMAEKHQDQLLELGFTKEEIEYIKVTPLKNADGHYSGLCPKRYNVHHKLPIHGGGQNEYSNFIIMPLSQHADLHEKVIDPQITYYKKGKLEYIGTGEKRKILVPWTDRNAYIAPSKIPGFDRSKDYISYQTGSRKISRNKDIFEDFSKKAKMSPSMEGEVDIEPKTVIEDALMKALMNRKNQGKR